MRAEPSVTVIVPNWNGEQHLPACLDSLRALDYPESLLEILIVENGSTDGSRELLRSRYPWVRVLEQPTNLGFTGGANAGANASSSDCLAFLNNDMRVESNWLRELVSLYAPPDDICVASVILDWEGEHVDFVEAFVNFHGAAGHLRYGDAIATVELENGRELPFACGGAMLVDRDVFAELGGFDPAFFALVEDVDFGWRLWLSGYRVRLAANASCFHRQSATTKKLGDAYRQYLSERNALRMVMKNVGDANFASIVGASLMLLTLRADLESGFDIADAATVESVTAPASALARVHAAADVVRDLDAVLEDRARVQSRRRRADADVFAVFRNPFIAVRGEEAYLETAARLTKLLRLEELLTPNEAGVEEPALSLEASDAAGQLLAKWRLEHGVGRPLWWHVRRALWRRLPDAARDRLRPRQG